MSSALVETDLMSSTAANATSARTMEPESLQPGFLVAERFELVRLLHAGANSAVFLASDHKDRAILRSLKVVVALKLIDRSVNDSLAMREQVRREAMRLSRFNHQNIVRVFECVEGPDFQAVSMEYVDGSSLDVQQELHKLSQYQLLNIFMQSAAALEALHLQELPHGAIGPQKILLTASGKTKLNLLDIDPPKSSEIENPADIRDPAYAYRKLGFTTDGDVYALALIAFNAVHGVYPGEKLPAFKGLMAKLKNLLTPNWLRKGTVPAFVELVSRTAYNEHELPSASAFHFALKRIYEDFMIANPRQVEQRERLELPKAATQTAVAANSAIQNSVSEVTISPQFTLIGAVAVYLIGLILLMKFVGPALL